MSTHWENFQREFWEIVTSGGVLMIPLTLLALGIYGLGLTLFFYFSAHPFYRIPRKKVASYVLNPVLASGEFRNILDYTQDAAVSNLAELRSRFFEIRSAYLGHIDAKRVVLLTMITTAPLTGLLGTVMGMLTTFQGLAIAVGGSTVDMIAAGISEALITTQTGLIIAIPAYVLAMFIRKRRNEMEAFLTTVETISIQLLEKRLKSSEDAA